MPDNENAVLASLAASVASAVSAIKNETAAIMAASNTNERALIVAAVTNIETISKRLHDQMQGAAGPAPATPAPFEQAAEAVADRAGS